VELRPLASWDCGLKSRRGHGCVSPVIIVRCQVENRAPVWSLVQRNSAECGVSERDLEASTLRRPWPSMTVRRVKNKCFYATLSSQLINEERLAGYAGGRGFVFHESVCGVTNNSAM
jgi:hypothetical protein